MRSDARRTLACACVLAACNSAQPSKPCTDTDPSASSSSSPSPSFALASLEEPAPPEAAPVTWSDAGVIAESASGNGNTAQVMVPADRVALRLASDPPAIDDEHCYRLDAVMEGGVDWLSSAPDGLAYGTALVSRATEGFWLLPEGASATDATLQFSLLDCRTGDPRSAAKLAKEGYALRWQTARLGPLPAAPILEARLGFARGVAVLEGSDGGLAFWTATLSHMRALFASADVKLVVSRLAMLPRNGDAVTTSAPGDEADLAAWAELAASTLGAGAGRSYVPVIIVPCLERSDPLSMRDLPVAGYTPRVPGGAREAGRAEAVFVAGTCAPDEGPPAATTLGNVLAHEIGHYLGLHHSDQQSGQALAEPGVVDLMDSNIAYREEALRWSPGQRKAMRLHPILR